MAMRRRYIGIRRHVQFEYSDPPGLGPIDEIADRELPELDKDPSSHISWGLLFNRDALCQVAWLVDIGALGDGRVIGQELHRSIEGDGGNKGLTLGSSTAKPSSPCCPASTAPSASDELS